MDPSLRRIRVFHQHRFLWIMGRRVVVLISCRLQQQIQLLSEREIVPYKVRFPDSVKLPASNIYGHQMAVVDDLKTADFEKFWTLLSNSEKQSILTVNEKEMNQQIKESVYWFSLRYALENYNELFSENRLIGLTRDTDSFFIPKELITDETLSRLIDYASTYDICMMPITPFSKQSQLFNEPENESMHVYQKSTEEMVVYYCILRFKMFLYWILCDHIDQAYQMHKKEEEANREAAILLKEAIDKEEKKRGKKKKKAKGKVEPLKPANNTTQTRGENQTKESTEVNQGSQKKELKQVQLTKRESSSDQKLQTNKKETFTQDKKVEEKTSSVESSPDTESLRRKTRRPHLLSAEALRVNRFLLGERRSDGIVVEKKREKEEVQKSEYLSLRRVFLRDDPMDKILQDAQVLDASEAFLLTNNPLTISTL